MAKKVLGQSNPAATTATTLYTVPSAKSAVISTLVIANLTSTAATYRIAVRPAGATLANSHYVAYDITVGASDSTALTLGITLATTDVVTVYASTANLTFTAFGDEAQFMVASSFKTSGVVAKFSKFRTLAASNAFLCDVLVVAGGGGGGQSGGGGAGGLLLFTSQPMTRSKTVVTVTVGAGGTGGTNSVTNGLNGAASVFGTNSTVGGGGGGAPSNGGPGFAGNSGGSGGGGGNGGSNGLGAGGAGTAGQGFAGATAGNDLGGGGGGAGAVGGNGASPNNGTGGNGSSAYSDWGLATSSGQNVSETYWYAGGGGVASYGSGVGGGNGGGAPGGNSSAGTANTGGGGGGAYGGNGGNGGSGIVIIRFSDTQADLTTIAAGLTYTKYTTGGYKYYKFTAGTGSVTV